MSKMKIPLSVLLVEDNEYDQEIIASKLYELPSFEIVITSVTTLSWAIKWLKKSNFDLIILDLGLPDSAGINTIKKIQEVSNTKTLVFTGAIMENQLLLDNNIKGFFPKNKLQDSNSTNELNYQIQLSIEVENVKNSRNALRIITSNLEQVLDKCQEIKKLE